MSSIPGQEERTSLRKSLDLLHTSANLGLVIAEGNRILDANDAFLRMIRCTREELPNFDWQAATPPEYLELDFRAMEQLRSLGACMPFEKEYVLADGSKVHFMVGAVRLQLDPLQWACYTVDLSEHKRAAQVEQRSRALRAKYDLINQLAHELNNPLAALTFQLHLLESHPGVVGDARKLVAEANEQLARISAIVQVVLAAGTGNNK
ncbi:MAG TPA: histidine kinase dimerization/phospho-acceptor domain-containing protein [Terriglobales bacterium]|nr:histidine kinase dimerization/phospho-acceptor domain-containing protein [Terriglobales bacterium]